MTKPFYILSLTLTVLFLIPFSAQAHRLSVFAWVEGDAAHVESKFSGGKSVQGACVVVKGPDGADLIEGKTDDNGMFSFRIPRKTDLKVVVSAGMGHQGDWTIRADEIEAAGSGAMPGDSKNAGDAAPETPVAPSSTPPADEQDEAPPAEISTEAVQTAVARVLDQKLTPVIRMLADQREAIGATEIFGGIGYIFGLFGVAAYVASRRKSGTGDADQ